MLDWLASFAFNWFQQDLCLQLNIQCRRNSANMVSVEFAAKSFFPICPEIKKMDSQRLMYFGNRPPSKRSSNRTFWWHRQRKFCSETNTQKQNGSIPDQKYQENLFRLSFTPDLMNYGRFTKIDSTHWGQRFSTTQNVFSGVQGAQCI